MSLVAFCPEEQVEAFGEILTLRFDFRAITIAEGALDMDLPTIVDHLRSPKPQYSVVSQFLWALMREHHPSVTLDQCLAMCMDRGADGPKVGFAIDALLNRAFPVAREDENTPPNPPVGRSKTSAKAG